MQLNINNYDDNSFDIEEMNNLASSINNFQNNNTHNNNTHNNNTHNNNRYNTDPENNIRIQKKQIRFEEPNNNSSFVGPSPRQVPKQPIANPIANYVQQMLEKKESEARGLKMETGKSQKILEPVNKKILEPVNQINQINQIKSTRVAIPVINNTNKNTNSQQSGLTYDDILKKMNIVVVNGTLHHLNDSIQQPQSNNNSNLNLNLKPEITKENSYIYNKYFKDYMKPSYEQTVLVPKTKEEYKRMLINQILDREIQRRKINEIKPKSMLNTQNIHVSPRFGTVPNKLFSFSR